MLSLTPNYFLELVSFILKSKEIFLVKYSIRNATRNLNICDGIIARNLWRN